MGPTLSSESPSALPTVSNVPSKSDAPSVSGAPSLSPSLSLVPSYTTLPSEEPSVSSVPSVSSNPTPSEETHSPSDTPSVMPSSIPTTSQVPTTSRSPSLSKPPSSSPSSSTSPTRTLHPSAEPTISALPSLSLTPTSGSAVETVLTAILPVAVGGGDELEDPESPQGQAIDFLVRYVSLLESSGRRQLFFVDFIAYYALASIFFSSFGVPNIHTVTDGVAVGGWKNSRNWLSFTDKCTWYGVICDTAGNIIAINLNDNNLIGYVAPEIQLLAPTLRRLNLNDNCYLIADGDIGLGWVGAMANLRLLFGGGTGFAYDGIPLFLNRLPNLRRLELAHNDMGDGPIRKEAFDAFTRLEYLDLGSNRYTSSFPSDIIELPSLLTFRLENVVILDGNELLLTIITKMPVLQELDVSGTSLSSGVIPTEIGLLASTLESLDLSFCGLTGAIPTNQIAMLTKLTFLDLRGNSFSSSSIHQVEEDLSSIIEGLQLLL